LPLPNLPGPKPQDYHFTNKTDSTFIFTVSEAAPDRQHAFFIYAVDNKGKADATPARVIFNALDRFPPIPIIELNGGGVATGKIYTLLQSGLVWERDTTVFVNDSLTIQNFAKPSSDTIPRFAKVTFTWRAEPAIAGTYVTGYRYKLDEPDFVVADSSGRMASYNTGIGNDVLAPGRKVFTLRAVDQAGGSREINRRFQLNYAPDTWFSGPDSTWSGYASNPSPYKPRERFLDVTDWRNGAYGPVTGSLLSCDSLQTWPAERPQRKTFFEVYKNRLYVRSEFDTVNMNSFVILHAGGSDRDTRYDVNVTDLDRTRDTLICGPSKTLRPGPPNGSPIGFHQYFGTAVEYGAFSAPAQGGVIPVFDATSVLRAPTIGAQGEMRRAGKVYAVVRSDDGFDYDRRINSRPDFLVNTVDAGGGTAQERALRTRVMVLYVDKAPYLLKHLATFVPKADGSTTFFSRQIDLVLPADDEDPLDPDTAPVGVGGPSSTKVLRWTVRVKGVTANGDTVAVGSTPAQSFSPNVTVQVPPQVVPGTILVSVEICDCAQCELFTGSGRCATYVFTANFQPPSPGTAPEATIGQTIEDRGHTSRGSKP